MDAGDVFEIIAEIALIGLFVYGIYWLTRGKRGPAGAALDASSPHRDVTDLGMIGIGANTFDPFPSNDSSNSNFDDKFSGGGGDFGGGGASDSWGSSDVGGSDSGGGGGDSSGGGSSD